MWILYLAVNNFGVALILFTLLVKIVSFPLNLKQQRNMAASQLFMPRVQEIQRKYKNNQPKMQEEMAKLQKEGYNPMGGCAPMLLIMVILFGVIDVVYKPMTHLERLDKPTIEIVTSIAMESDYANILLASTEDAELIAEFAKNTEDTSIIKIVEADENPQPQITLPSDFSFQSHTAITNEEREKYGTVIVNNFELLTNRDSRLSKPVKDKLVDSANRYKSLHGEINALQVYINNPEAFHTSRVTDEIRQNLDKLAGTMEFCGLKLWLIPTLAVEPLIAIPIIAFIFSFLQVLLTQKLQELNKPVGAPEMPQPPGMKAMLYIAPFFSLIISFTVPAGAGLYWGVSYAFGIAQSLITQKFWPTEKLREDARKKNEASGSKFAATATIVEVDETGNEVRKVEQLSNLSTKEQKEYYRKKLEEARKADAIKYGEIPCENDADVPNQNKKNINPKKENREEKDFDI